jgi:uncharacterized membrane protein YoaT (DUF817 family)
MKGIKMNKDMFIKIILLIVIAISIWALFMPKYDFVVKDNMMLKCNKITGKIERWENAQGKWLPSSRF